MSEMLSENKQITSEIKSINDFETESSGLNYAFSSYGKLRLSIFYHNIKIM